MFALLGCAIPFFSRPQPLPHRSPMGMLNAVLEQAGEGAPSQAAAVHQPHSYHHTGVGRRPEELPENETW